MGFTSEFPNRDVDYFCFPWLFDPPASDGDTQPLSLPPAPLLLPELGDDLSPWPPLEVEPLDSVAADSADGYTDEEAYDDGEDLS